MNNQTKQAQIEVQEKTYTEKELQDLLDLNKEQLLEEEIEKRLTEAKQEFEKEKEEWRVNAVDMMNAKIEERAENKAITIANQYKELSPKMKEFQEQREIVEFYVEGKALPDDMTAAKMLVMLEAGKPMGLTFMECMTGMAFIRGRLTIYGPVYLSIISRAGYRIKFIDRTNTKVKVILTGPNGEMEGEYTKEMAETAGLRKDTYLRYPIRMLSYKAIKEAQNFLCPEIMGGVILAEEVDEYPAQNGADTTTEDIADTLVNSGFKKAEEIIEGEVTLTPNSEANEK